MLEKNRRNPSVVIHDADISKIMAYHSSCANSQEWPHHEEHPPTNTTLWGAISENHRNNSLLWAEEDLARRKLAPDAEIAANKRNIDKFNQARNDAIEAIDEHLLAWAYNLKSSTKNAKINSESAGSIIDRLSILCLKKRAFSKQLERIDVEESHINTCHERLLQLSLQERDLADCYSELISDAKQGIIRWKIYKQFKMYNDPSLNPQIYLESKPE
jgi:hypothetical protein